MKLFVKVVFLLCFLCCQVLCKSNVTISDCDKKLKVMDDAVKKCLIISDPDMKPFNTTQELKESFCEPYKGWVKEINDYRDCMKNFQRTVFGLVVRNMKKNGEKYCDNEEHRVMVTKHSKCMGPEVAEAFNLISNRITILVEKVTDRPDINELIPGLCCGFHLVLDKIEKETKKLCDKNTGLKTGKFVRNLIRDTMSEAIELLCSQFSTKKICKEKLPAMVGELKESFNQNSPVYNHTVVTSLIRFFERLDSRVNV